MAFRSCADCRLFLYDEKTGRRAEHAGKPVQRPKGTFPPCHYGPQQCPKGSPEAGRELTEQNLSAWQHHAECRAVGAFPDDEIVRRNASIIDRVERQQAASQQDAMQQMIATALGIKRAM